MSSQSTSDGTLRSRVTFAARHQHRPAQVLVQNRVAIAEPRLPDVVRRLGVTVKKASPDLLMVVNLISPDGTPQPALPLELRHPDDQGPADAAGRRRRRARLRPARLHHAGLARPRQAGGAQPDAGDVRRRASRAERPGRRRRHRPAAARRGARRLPGQRSDPGPADRRRAVRRAGHRQTGADGASLRLRDVARVELGAADYTVNAYARTARWRPPS